MSRRPAVGVGVGVGVGVRARARACPGLCLRMASPGGASCVRSTLRFPVRHFVSPASSGFPRSNEASFVGGSLAGGSLLCPAGVSSGGPVLAVGENRELAREHIKRARQAHAGSEGRAVDWSKPSESFG